MGGYFGDGVSSGNKAVDQNKLIQIPHFHDEDNHIYGNEGAVDDGIIFGSNCISKRYHKVLRLSQTT